VVLLFVETYFLRKFIPDLPQSLVVLIFLASVFAIGMTSGYLEWKFTELEEIPREELQ
jgi:predicted Abi (CAAX) family protease